MTKAEKILLGALVGVACVLTGRYLYKKFGDHPAPPPTGIDLTFAKTVAEAAKTVVRRTPTTNGLRPEDPGDPGKVDRHRYFFLHRRALNKGKDDANLRTGAGLQTLQQRVVKEYDQVFAFLQTLVGDSSSRGPYYGGAETGPSAALHQGEARHLELGQYVRSRLYDPSSTIEDPSSFTEAASVAALSPTSAQASTLRELDLRRMHVIGIVWRAAALDGDMWDGSEDTTTLQTGELTKMLDRRLRTVERLRYEVSAGATDNGIGSSFVERVWSPAPPNRRSTKEGPWQDDYLVRAFETPSLPRTAKSDDGSWVAEDFFLNNRLARWQLSNGLAQSGTFVLELDGEPTAPLDFNAADIQVQDALRALPDHSSLVITCSGTLPEGPMSIAIAGNTTAIPELKVRASNLSGPLGHPTAMLTLTANEIDVEIDGDARFSLGDRTCRWYRNDMTGEFDFNVPPGTRIASDSWALPVRSVTQPPSYGWFMLPPHDRVNLTILGTPTGGTFTLEFDGQSTAELSHNASAEQVQHALAAIPTGEATILCWGGPLPGAGIQIILQNAVGSGPRLKVGAANLTGGFNVKLQVFPRTGSTDLPGRIIHDLFAPVVQPPGSNLFNPIDWWNRSWLHSDGMLAALHLEGLRHALLRQPIAGGARPDDEFNGLTAKYSFALDDYFEVRKVSRMPNGIMARGRTDYFDNDSADLDDLQIGDQILFATNPALIALGRGAWDPLTVLVTDVDTSPDDPRTNLNKLRVQGFGTADQTLASLQLQLVKQADQALKGVQAFIPAEIDRLRAQAGAAGQPFTAPEKLSWDIGVITQLQKSTNDAAVLHLWNPYGDTWDNPGPWWVRFDLGAQLWDGAFGNDVDKILSQFPGAILWLENDKVQFANKNNPWRPTGAAPVAATASGFREPPWQDSLHTSHPDTAIFIPLFQPFGGWESYFDFKAKSPAEAWPSKLDPVTADARWVAGLAKSSLLPTQVRVIRPRTKPHA